MKINILTKVGIIYIYTFVQSFHPRLPPRFSPKFLPRLSPWFPKGKHLRQFVLIYLQNTQAQFLLLMLLLFCDLIFLVFTVLSDFYICRIHISKSVSIWNIEGNYIDLLKDSYSKETNLCWKRWKIMIVKTEYIINTFKFI